MSPQAVTANELIEYLTDIADEHGDIPVIVYSAVSGKVESVGRPIVLTVAPAGEADGFQTYSCTPQEDAPRTKAALIN
nr:MAG TPA: Homing endonuclease repeat [Caudoviricetes sp.]